jgi:malate dehydrogenase (oxaloacetate-decarboxylating)
MQFRALTDPTTGAEYLPVAKRGDELLHDPLLNKGAAFTRQEREEFDLEGLLPDHVATMEEQLDRVRNQFDRKDTDLERNIYLNSLMDRNETLFYRFVVDNLEDVVPIIYTPTVAEACRYWSFIFRRARGIYITPRDRGRVAKLLQARPVETPPIIVVTDNERILGIGDQGAGGMGIPIGKLALYTAAAGIRPARCIPISIDVGTDNQDLLDDPLYLGYREPRERGPAYDELIKEFVDAVREVYPGALLQWEDFANRTSFHNLETYRGAIASFNDDIQGTAAMVVAGLLAATRHLGGRLGDHRIVIAGAGSAGYGIREQVSLAMAEEGTPLDRARHQIYVLDRHGLLEDARDDLTGIKGRLATPTALTAAWETATSPASLLDVIANVRPSVLVGVSGSPGLFDESALREMAKHVERPIVLPLSNPTSFSEVLPADAIEWSEGRALVATGSPFPGVVSGGDVFEVGQANNAFIFPGVGLGVLVSHAAMVSDGMFIAAARALSGHVTDAMIERGRLYPEIDDVRGVSRDVAIAVADAAIADGLADPIEDVAAAVEREMWAPRYVPYRAV